MNDGYIKYGCQWRQSGPITFDEFDELNHWRERLYHTGIIGITQNGIGFGNISVRATPGLFIISGSATGGLARLGPEHYSRVLHTDISLNTVDCEGAVRASSESLTHWAVYEQCPRCMAVAHGHHPEAWRRWLDYLPTTDREAAYGTPELAQNVARLIDGKTEGTLILGGHEDGLLTFGPTLEAAGTRMLNLLT